MHSDKIFQIAPKMLPLLLFKNIKNYVENAIWGFVLHNGTPV
jgi:hypothetical protein